MRNNILVINPWAGYIGPNTFFQQLVNEIIERSYNVTVIYPYKDEISQVMEKNGVKFYYTRIIEPIHYNNKVLKLLNYLKKEINFYIFLKKIKMDFDFCFINTELFSFSLYSIKNIPNKFNVIHSLSFTKNILFSKSIFLIQNKINITNIAVSKIVMDNVKSICPKSKISYFYNGVNIDQNYKRKKNTSCDNIFNLLSVLHPVPHKGAHHLIEVLIILNKLKIDFKCIIVGWDSTSSDFIYKNKIENLIRNSNLQGKVHLLPSENNLFKYYSNADILIHPSESESFGYVIAEAMSYELPVVAFEVGAIPEIIKNNFSGFLVKPFNVNIMATLVHKLFLSKKLNSDFGSAGREIIIKDFNKSKNMSKLLNFCLISQIK